jgi:molybdopterin synthase sulfur carrier subunit
MTTLKIKAFGITRDMIGGRELVLEIGNENTVLDLRRKLQEKYPAMSRLKSLFIAVNNEYADDTKVLTANDEIALIPPVSGG